MSELAGAKVYIFVETVWVEEAQVSAHFYFDRFWQILTDDTRSHVIHCPFSMMRNQGSDEVKGPKNLGRHQRPTTLGDRSSAMSAMACAPNPVKWRRSRTGWALLTSLDVIADLIRKSHAQRELCRQKCGFYCKIFPKMWFFDYFCFWKCDSIIWNFLKEKDQFCASRTQSRASSSYAEAKQNQRS